MSSTTTKRMWSARCIAVLALIFANSAFAQTLPTVFFYNAGFEQPTAPDSPGYKYTPAAGDPGEPLGWTFGNGSGVSNKKPLNAFTSGTPLAGTGQVGFLQNAAQITQPLTLAAGTYSIFFRATQRSTNQSGTQTIAVYRDSTYLGQFTPGNGDLQSYTTPPFTVSGGTYTFKLKGIGSGTDYTAFIDGVAINASSTYDSIYSNNVRIVTPGSPPLIAPALANAINNPGTVNCSLPTPTSGGPGTYDAYHTTFSYMDALCNSSLYVANINPIKGLGRYYWAEGATQITLTFSINSTYRGRGYSQPVLEFFHAKYKESGTDLAHYTFYVNPQLFDGEPLPPGYIFNDSCGNGCTGKPLISGWFGDANPYMTFGTSARCAQGNFTTNTSCAFNNASVTISLAQFTQMLTDLNLPADQQDPKDWRLGDYAFNVEMPTDSGNNSYIDQTVSGVQLAATTVALPTATFYINGQANGSATIPNLGSFTLSYSSQNATSCDLSATQNGQPWYTYLNNGLSEDWGTISGWGGPATFSWTATCKNAQGQTASSTANLTISSAAAPSVIFYINGIANGSATMASLGSFTLNYASQNATSCDLSAIQNGAPWYTYPNYGLSYNWGTLSGWGGPATYSWTATCRNALGQTASSTASLTITAAGGPPTINNNSFESPVVGAGAYAYNPSGGSWTFDAPDAAGGSGVSGNNSAFTNGSPPAPLGNQVGFIQGAHAFSQSVTFGTAGTYKVKYSAVQRSINQQSLQVKVQVDGGGTGTIAPSGTSYSTYTTGTFTVTAGAHTIKFLGVNSSGGDNTVFFDNVQVVSP